MPVCLCLATHCGQWSFSLPWELSIMCLKNKKNCSCKRISGSTSGRWGERHSAAYEHGLGLLMIGDCLLLQPSWNHGAGVFFPVAMKYLPSLPSDLPLYPHLSVKQESSCLPIKTFNSLFTCILSKMGDLWSTWGRISFVLASEIILKSSARWIISSFFPWPIAYHPAFCRENSVLHPEFLTWTSCFSLFMRLCSDLDCASGPQAIKSVK